MLYQTLSSNPAAWRLDGGALVRDRLDAGYYTPKYLDVAARLRNLGVPVQPFKKLCSKLNCGSTPKQVEYGPAGMPLIRTTNVRPNHYDDSDVQRVAGLNLPVSSNIAIVPGDVLYTMSGTIGFAAVYPEGLERASCSNTIARGRIDPASGHDAYYVAAFLNSSLGYSQSLRLVSGGVLAHVMPNSVKELLVATPSPAVQRAIGNKLRKAERLTALAAESMALADFILSKFAFGDDGRQVSGAPRWFGTDTFTGRSWDAEFNRTLEAQARLVGALPLGSLIKSCRSGDAIESSARRKGPYRYFGASGPIDWHDQWNTAGEMILVAQDGTLGIATVADGKYWANNHVWICRLHDAYSQHAVARFLTKFYPYWPGLTTGSVVPKVTSENLALVSVPEGVALAHDAGDLIRGSQALILEATESSGEATTSVEALIAGTLHEPALLAESDAIEVWLAANPNPASKA